MKRLLILLILAVLTAAPTDRHPRAAPPSADGVAAAEPAPEVQTEGPASPAPLAVDVSADLTVVGVEVPPPASDVVEVFRDGFEDAGDEDYDGWPDGWRRQRGPGYPWYLRIGLSREPAPEGDQALKMTLDGGAAAIFSRPIPVRSQFSYLFEGYLRTEGLKHDHAYFTVSFFNAAGKRLHEFTSEKVGGTQAWRKLAIGPMTSPAAEVDHAVIGLHLSPGAKADLTGSAAFDGVWLGRMPGMTLATNSPFNLFSHPGGVEVRCDVSGIFEQDPLIQFQLFDIDGREVQIHEEALQALPDADADLAYDQPPEDLGFRGTARWRPEIATPGFYRLRGTLRCGADASLSRELTLAVLEPAQHPSRGEFGWNLTGSAGRHSLVALEKILPQMGINWVKLPMWTSEQDDRRLDQLVGFAERMSAQGIETVGVLSEPPADVRAHFGEAPSLLAADMFTTEPELWYPLLEPMLARLSLQVRWWQLGSDEDVSFVGYPRLVPTISRIKDELQRFGQVVHLGFGWRFFDEQMPTENPPWSFLTLTARPQLTSAEVTDYLAALENPNVRRWLSMEPLSKRHYALDVRVQDLIRRMLAAKMAGAEGFFIAAPFNDETGLMHADGTPTELLLPWRTTALVLAGSRYLGSLALPGGSQNYVFERDGAFMMVVWNDRPTTEAIYLGDTVEVVDVWGRRQKPATEAGTSQLQTGPMPTFVTGINPAIIRWSLSVGLQQVALPSVFGTTHDNALLVTNTFGQGVSAQARLNLPDSWRVVPRVLNFKLATGEESAQPFGIALPYDASNGRQRLRIDFEVNAEQRYAFSVYRDLQIGDDEVTLQATTQLNQRGELEVEQVVTNRTDESLSFKCFLYVPDRRRLTTQVIELTRDRDRKLYRLPEGGQLVGKTLWLRAEELSGNRTLNLRIVAEE